MPHGYGSSLLFLYVAGVTIVAFRAHLGRWPDRWLPLRPEFHRRAVARFDWLDAVGPALGASLAYGSILFIRWAVTLDADFEITFKLVAVFFTSTVVTRYLAGGVSSSGLDNNERP